MKIGTLAAVSAIAITAAGAASALTLTAFDDSGFAYPDPANSTTILGGTVVIPFSATIAAGNDSGIFRSPYDEGATNDIVENSTLTDADEIQYFVAGPSSTPNPIVLAFAEAQTSFSFLWGSPDDYNTLTFKLNGAVVDSYVGSAVTTPTSFGSVFAEYEGRFDTVEFLSDPNNAFEFASIETTPVPLPAAGWMLLAGLGGMAAMKRRKKA